MRFKRLVTYMHAEHWQVFTSSFLFTSWNNTNNVFNKWRSSRGGKRREIESITGVHITFLWHYETWHCLVILISLDWSTRLDDRSVFNLIVLVVNTLIIMLLRLHYHFLMRSELREGMYVHVLVKAVYKTIVVITCSRHGEGNNVQL